MYKPLIKKCLHKVSEDKFIAIYDYSFIIMKFNADQPTLVICHQKQKSTSLLLFSLSFLYFVTLWFAIIYILSILYQLLFMTGLAPFRFYLVHDWLRRNNCLLILINCHPNIEHKSQLLITTKTTHRKWITYAVLCGNFYINENKEFNNLSIWKIYSFFTLSQIKITIISKFIHLYCFYTLFINKKSSYILRWNI